jgi:hypothetical protein
MTVARPWIYNRVGANLTGILVLLLGLGLYSMQGAMVSARGSLRRR